MQLKLSSGDWKTFSRVLLSKFSLFYALVKLVQLVEKIHLKLDSKRFQSFLSLASLLLHPYLDPPL